MKKSAFVFFGFVSVHVLWALPGFRSALPDVSGSYAYYEDKTFTRKSFTGFLCYDEKTYAARYVAPPKNKLLKLSVTLFFTVDEKKDFIEITGERIESERTKDDGEIINYLHDMVYELHARRRKAKNISRDRLRTDNIMQFGGDVVVEYDELVPIFNIRRIAKADGGDAVFELVTIGKLSSNDDASFENFEGAPDSYASGKNQNSASIKTDVKQTIFSLNEGARISLDAQWNAQLQNVWTLSNDAMLTVSKLQGVSKANEKFLLRAFLQSGSGAIVDWRTLDAEPKLIAPISVISYNIENKKATRIFRKVRRSSSGEYFLCTLAVFETTYGSYKNYFKKIVHSFAVK